MKTKEQVKKILIFIAIFIVFSISGGVFGTMIAKLSFRDIDSSIFLDPFYQFLVYVIPSAVISCILISGTLCYSFYHNARLLFDLWEGDDDDTIALTRYSLNQCVVVCNTSFIIYLLLCAIWIHLEKTLGDIMDNIIAWDITFILGFLVGIVIVFIFQFAALRLAKDIGPENQGVLLNLHFTKVWDNDNGTEIMVQYKAAYKAFKRLNTICLILWFVCVLAEVTIDSGIMPVLCVTIIWLVSVITYQMEVTKLAKR